MRTDVLKLLSNLHTYEVPSEIILSPDGFEELRQELRDNCNYAYVSDCFDIVTMYGIPARVEESCQAT